MHKIFAPALGAAALGLLAPLHAQAADFTFNGSIGFHNDKVLIDFSLGAASNVSLFTDSWRSGLKFDPVLALWQQTVPGVWTLLSEVDDDTVGTGQAFFDAGILAPTLAAGSYCVSVVASINLANGTLLSNGFAYDSQAPIALASWNQPSYNPNTNDQKGGFWQLQLRGVDQASVVPEPGQWLLLALGPWRRLALRCADGSGLADEGAAARDRVGCGAVLCGGRAPALQMTMAATRDTDQ